MTRFSITMDEALDFILESTRMVKGSEIFVPKLHAYTIADLRDALFDLIGKKEEKKIPIRPGEKMHEILINEDEIRYTWEIDNKYVIFNPSLEEKEIRKSHPNIKKVTNLRRYSSDLAEKISKDNLKNIIKQTGMLNN